MNEPVNDKAYYQTFQTDRVGRLIFEELCGVFYDIEAFDADNPYKTAFMAGQRSVLKHIIMKIQSADLQEDNTDK